MATIDLHTAIPEVLAEAVSTSYEELWATVRAIADWDDRQAQVLDHLYRQRLLRLISSREPLAQQQEELRTLIDHLERVTHESRSERLNALEQPYATRWETYRDILTSRLAALESQAPGQVRERHHVERILRTIAEAGTIRQQELLETLGLRPANLTRILNILEANLLIERRTVGREKAISLGLAAEDITPQARGAASDTPRGCSYFCLEAA